MQLTIDEDTVLRTWVETDSETLFALVEANRAQLAAWLPWVPKTTSTADSLAFIKQSSSDPRSEQGVEFGIWYRGELAGCLGLHEILHQDFRTSIGYWLGKRYQGRGIMTKSVARLIDYCFIDLSLHRIEIRTCVDNTASSAVANRLGFSREGILRDAEYINGTFRDLAVYALLAGEQ